MPKMLLVGNDPQLLQTRAAVLEETGAELVCCDIFEAFLLLEKERFDVAVLCHTIQDDELRNLIAACHHRWPTTKVLCVMSNLRRGIGERIGPDAMSTPEPSVLIRQIRELLRQPARQLVEGGRRMA